MSKLNSDNNPRAQTSAGKWNEAHQTPNYHRRFLMNLPFAKTYLNQLYLDGRSPISILRDCLPDGPAEKALELAGGRGDFAMNVLHSGIANNLHMIDISDQAIEIAIKKACEKGLDGFTASVGDVNSIQIEGFWDLIIFHQSLHHIEALEHVLAEVKKSLLPGGLFLVSDYIGPTKMQWSNTQLKIMNDLLEIIPENLRLQLNKDGTDSGNPKKSIAPLPLEIYEKFDPSEAVRSGEIETVIRDTFDFVEFYPQGGAISYELFRNMAHNYEDETSKALLKTILYFEHQLTEKGVIEPNFGVFVCR
jgi:SAM-dependent methyltransferase